MAKRKKPAADPELVPELVPEPAAADTEKNENLIAWLTRDLATNPINEKLFKSRDTLENLRAAYRELDTNPASLERLTKSLLDAMIETAPVLYFITEVYDLEPYLWPKLQELDPELAGKSFDNFLDRFTLGELHDMAENPDNPFSVALAEARAAQAVAEPDKVLPRITYKKSEETAMLPTDKWSNLFFSRRAPKPKHPENIAAAQLSLDLFTEDGNSIEVAMEKRGHHQESLFYDYGFAQPFVDAYGLQNFSDFDFFVCSAMDNLYLRGDTEVTATKIWHEMGGVGTPAAKQLKDVRQSVAKGISTIILLDSKKLAQARGWEDFESYLGQAFPAKYVNRQKVINGKLVTESIFISGLSPFGQLSLALGNYTTISRKILSLPVKVNKGNVTRKIYENDRFFAVFRYLLREITWMRNPNCTRLNTKIVYESLYEAVGDKTQKEREATRDVLYGLLDSRFMPIGYVLKYKETEKNGPTPGVVLTLDQDYTQAGKAKKRRAAKNK